MIFIVPNGVVRAVKGIQSPCRGLTNFRKREHMHRSAFFRPIFRTPIDLPGQCSTSSGAFRFSIPSWLWIVVLGIPTLGLYLSQDMTRAPRAADRSLLGEHAACVESVAFDPRGRWLAAAGSDGAVYLWDVHRHEVGVALKQEIIRVLDATASRLHPIVGAAFSPDGKLLATASPYSGIALWDAMSGRRLKTEGLSDGIETASPTTCSPPRCTSWLSTTPACHSATTASTAG